MPTIINRSQQLYTGGMYPVSAYSRVMSLRVEVHEALGPQFAYSPVIGNNVWITEIKCWVRRKPVNVTHWTAITITCGQGEAPTAAEVANWENLLPIYYGRAQPHSWVFHDGEDTKTWDLAKRFEGKSRRLGLYCVRIGFLPDVVQVSFRIAEG